MKCNALNQAPGTSLLQDIFKNKNKMFFLNAPACCHVSYMLANMSEHFLKEAQRSTWKGLANSPHFELNAKKKATVLHWLYTRTHTWKLEPNDQLSRFFSLQCVTWMLRVWCFVCSTHYSAAHNYTSSPESLTQVSEWLSDHVSSTWSLPEYMLILQPSRQWLTWSYRPLTWCSPLF